MSDSGAMEADPRGPLPSVANHPAQSPRRLVRRHAWPVRVFHWVNFVALTVMLGSGLQIFNAHPALYWGQGSNFPHPLLALEARRGADGHLIGVTRIGSAQFDTTGVLGLSTGSDGKPSVRGFPTWATIPGPRWLAMGRLWHFFFAWIFVLNGLAFTAYAVVSGHLWRDLLPRLRELGHIGREILDHALLRFPKGEAARRYNVLQKLSYLGVIFGLGPLVLLTGLTLSPTMDANWPWLLDLFGGRQSARTIHFICAFSFVAFFLVHIAMVVLSGPINNLRSMITGRYAIDSDSKPTAGGDDE